MKLIGDSPSFPSERRPRLLFLTYGFPPVRRIGAVRTWNMAKHLARAGWDVTVVTPEPSLLRDVEYADLAERNLNVEGVRRLPTGHHWRWLAAGAVKCRNEGLSWALGGMCRRVARQFSVDPTIGWIKPAERACSNLRPGDVDIILASGPPFSAFSLAGRLAERLGCPFMLDYRDLWSQNLHNPTPAAFRTEAELLARSAAVTVVSPSWASVLSTEFGIHAKVHVVSNGYDSEDLASVAGHDFGHFAIVYAGVLYPPKRVISPVMAALQCLERRSRNDKWMFHYYGTHGRGVLEAAERFGLTARVTLHGKVAWPTALAAVKGAGVVVVITSISETGTPEENGMVTGKIFEAIGLGTPILLVAPSGSDANRLGEATGLVRTFPGKDVEGIASFLSDLINGKSIVPKEPTAYAWENLVRQMHGVLLQSIWRQR
jgi:Glycosyl transferase 4-like domain